MSPPVTPLRWGLIGPGTIARRFADALTVVPGARLAAVCGGRPSHAEAFAAHWPATVHHELAALLADPQVDAVYVATPHSAHAEAVAAALEAGKPVLCEKPLVATAAQARAVVALAGERRVFLMEALWSRFLPSWQQLRAWIEAGEIGTVHTVQGTFCLRLPFDPASRLFAPALAGGALLDIGVYALSLAQWVMQAQGGGEPEGFDVTGRLAPTGVDLHLATQLRWAGGAVAQFVIGFDGAADNACRIHGQRGTITLQPNFWECTRVTLQRRGEPEQTLALPFRHNGFEYQIEAATACIAVGQLENAAMPLAQTLAVAELSDAMRQRLGVRYPFE
ncbi:putative dehydrogenase [Rubrivivax gelatinosus]|uniref:Gfo/Idh/MocA family protein n=2 Tax=Rubrivivax gelatinosus TaxID=28068 RepID=UPI0018C93C1F|nr:Gfo/Idh/MocA family oxidoreductase [Rubrivivax gelatinosus]MBG6082290.1 putative dehydrogenase [Rubrivivax gelatinosus]